MTPDMKPEATFTNGAGDDTADAMDQSMDAILWAIDDACDASMASADWLARDIDPNAQSAVRLLTSADTPLERLKQAKAAYKTMRIVGETPKDRRVGARMYLASIAAALLFHDTRITTQSSDAIKRSLQKMQKDESTDFKLRELAERALHRLSKTG